MVCVLMLCNLNIMAKAIVGLMIVFCIFVMRSIQTAYQLPDDIDPDTMLAIEPHGKLSEAMPTEKLDHNSNVDLISVFSSRLMKNWRMTLPIDQKSPSYNFQLNNRIAERLESLDKDKNK